MHDPDGYNDDSLDNLLSDFGFERDIQPNKTPTVINTAGKPKLTLEVVDSRIHDAYNGRMKRVTDYWGRFSPLTCVCSQCGTKSYKSRAEGFFRGYKTTCNCEDN